jgi:hypothetical protein
MFILILVSSANMLPHTFLKPPPKKNVDYRKIMERSFSDFTGLSEVRRQEKLMLQVSQGRSRPDLRNYKSPSMRKGPERPMTSDQRKRDATRRDVRENKVKQKVKPQGPKRIEIEDLSVFPHVYQITKFRSSLSVL